MPFKQTETRIWKLGKYVLSQAKEGDVYQMWTQKVSSGQIVHMKHVRQFVSVEEAETWVQETGSA